VIDALLKVAEEAGRTPAQMALNWLLQQPSVTAPIIGARTIEQLDANLGASGWALGGAQAAQLDQASAAPLPYPYEHVTRAELRR
jgi:aryl-alcohol dehydrogenase-like predicted oxidoreductase